jgi:hypothetical protein
MPVRHFLRNLQMWGAFINAFPSEKRLMTILKKFIFTYRVLNTYTNINISLVTDLFSSLSVFKHGKRSAKGVFLLFFQSLN